MMKLPSNNMSTTDDSLFLVSDDAVVLAPEENTKNHTNSTAPPSMEPYTTTTTSTSTNMVVVGILVGLIVVLTIILVILLVRPVMDFIRARLPENKRRKELRYRTVEGWLISKVCICTQRDAQREQLVQCEVIYRRVVSPRDSLISPPFLRLCVVVLMASASSKT